MAVAEEERVAAAVAVDPGVPAHDVITPAVYARRWVTLGVLCLSLTVVMMANVSVVLGRFCSVGHLPDDPDAGRPERFTRSHSAPGGRTANTRLG